MFLSSKEELNDYHKNDFNIDGVELTSSRDVPGYQQYNVKIVKKIFLYTLDSSQSHVVSKYSSFLTVNSRHTC